MSKKTVAIHVGPKERPPCILGDPKCILEKCTEHDCPVRLTLDGAEALDLLNPHIVLTTPPEAATFLKLVNSKTARAIARNL